MSKTETVLASALLLVLKGVTDGSITGITPKTEQALQDALCAHDCVDSLERGTRYFELTLPGFDGGTDETDDLVLWLEAPNAETILAYVPDGSTVVPLDKVSEEDIDFVIPADGLSLRARARQLSPAAAPPSGTQIDILEVARNCGLRSHVHLSPSDARPLLSAFIEAWQQACRAP